MGGSSGFASAVKPLIATFESIGDDILLVDASYLFYGLPSGLKYKLFMLERKNAHLEDVINKVSESIHQEIGKFKPSKYSSVYIVFEDRASSKSIRRHRRGQKSNSTILNKAIREAFLSRSMKSKFSGKNKIAKAMGRPPQWISHLMMANLKSRGFNCLHARASVQADEVIIRIANHFSDNGFTVSVLGNDRDFIAFSKPNSINRIVYKEHRGLVQLCWQTVADHLKLENPNLLPYAYAFGGCDDISTSIYRFGWTSAFKMAKKSKSLDEFQRQINACYENSPTNGPKVETINKELDALLKGKFIKTR